MLVSITMLPTCLRLLMLLLLLVEATEAVAQGSDGFQIGKQSPASYTPLINKPRGLRLLEGTHDADDDEDGSDRVKAPYVPCPQGMFRPLSPFNILPEDPVPCRACSLCPRGLPMVRSPCTQTSDTVCASFSEFEFYKEGIRQREENKNWMREESSGSMDTSTSLLNSDRKADEGKYETLSKVDTVEFWQELCLALACGLCIAILGSVVYCVFVAVRNRNKVITLKASDDVTFQQHIILTPSGQLQSRLTPGSARAISVPQSLVHIETQAQENSRHRSLMSRLLGRQWSSLPGNEYVHVLEAYRNTATTERDSCDRENGSLLPEVVYYNEEAIQAMAT